MSDAVTKINIENPAAKEAFIRWWGTMEAQGYSYGFEALEDVGCLALSVMDVTEPWQQPSDCGKWVDDGKSSVWDEADLPPSWCVTPGGEEVDLRGDGLFG